MKSDIEIAQEAKMIHIRDVAKQLGISEDDLEMYGKYKTKLTDELWEEVKDREDGKLILVTAINPTPAGEGKTTTSVGLGEAFGRMGKKAAIALREPSLGPCFGIKGGAAGGGYAQVVPMEELNLHFTGDFHAITSANNLLAAMLDNHIKQGNALQIDTNQIVWKRCMDMNDRVLRNIVVGLGRPVDGVVREDHFIISVASEIMAILCLAENIKDLKERLSKIIVAYNYEGMPVTAGQLNAVGAMAALLKDALKPNMVQTLENTPAFVHGGPFANIAHGCNSVIATKLALKLGEYVITEAGFGADLGAEKFLDIKCRKANLKPDAIVCVATIKALKYHGGMPKEDIKNESVEYLAKGFENLERHVDNLKNNYGLNVIVAINKYTHDTENEIKFLQNKLQEKGINLSLVESWEKGGEGAEDLAQKIVDLAQEPTNFKFAYELSESIESKIKAVAQKIYGAEDVEFTDKAKQHIEEIKKMGYENMPVCIAKTQYSFSDDPKNLECKEPFTIHVQDVVLRAGAEFIVVLTGKIMTMPGLPKVPSAESIDLDENGNIVGIF